MELCRRNGAMLRVVWLVTFLIGTPSKNPPTKANGSHVKKMPSRVGYRPGVREEPYTKWDAHKDEIEVDYKQLDDEGSGGSVRSAHLRGGRGSSAAAECLSGTKGILLCVLFVVTVFLTGTVIGYAVAHRGVHHLHTSCTTQDYHGYSLEISELLSSKISSKHIEQYLRNYTTEVHLAGTHSNNALGNTLLWQLKNFGLTTRTPTYNVLLSYPDWEKPSHVQLLNESNGAIMFETSYQGPKTDFHPEQRQQYNAFAPNGTVQGDIIFANYGEESDFKILQKKGVTCADKIVIMKYGKIYRGHKLKNAEACGALGVLLYPDPRDVTGVFHEPGDVYPATWYLPPWAAQDGCVLPTVAGDPLTPGLPSRKNIYRRQEKDADLPKIPSLPISWGDAKQILSFMGGPSGEDSFQGNLGGNVTYKIGPGYTAPRQNWKVRLEVNNEREQREIRNIIGMIKGDREPDRYIILGCHYDAWSFGGVDPNSGTSIITELARAFSELVTKGWQPHRTLMFVHLDGEEQGLMGSYEWVEEHEKELSERTVLFINLDGAIRGNWSLDVQASPVLQQLLYDVTKGFSSVTDPEISVYDEWMLHKHKEAIELYRPIAGGSDHAPFVYTLGVAAMRPIYSHNIHDGPLIYPAYHSPIDKFEYVKEFVDPSFKSHSVMAQVLGELEYAIGNLSFTTTEFEARFEQVDENNLLEVRLYNDKLLRVQQAFVYSPGLPGRPQVRNVLLASSAVDSSSAVPFPGVYDALKLYCKSTNSLTCSHPQHEENNTNNSTEMPESHEIVASIDSLWGEVEKQISIATLAVLAADNILHDVIT